GSLPYENYQKGFGPTHRFPSRQCRSIPSIKIVIRVVGQNEIFGLAESDGIRSPGLPGLG
ncbi:MAG: hypothetical protein KDA84_12305, partial [Planctomycetaceae bacterium]|nr:hypothetical protein [Planctomycetaceae bacterium]